MTNRDFFLHLTSSEHPRFLGVLKATPASNLDYRPHPRSRSAYELVGHMLGHEVDLVALARTGSIDHQIQVPFGSIDEAVKIYEQAHAEAVPALTACDDSAWEQVGQFRVQGKVLMEAPRRDLAWMLLLDAIHHRGQLSTYLRPMGGTVPGIYGPSADTPRPGA